MGRAVPPIKSQAVNAPGGTGGVYSPRDNRLTREAV
jgi:hypothetical protein